MYCILRFSGKVKDFTIYLKTQKDTLNAYEKMKNFKRSIT